MSNHEIKLSSARFRVKNGMVGLHNRLNILTNDLICRTPLQDDEDDALENCADHILNATRDINRAIDALEG